MQIQVNDCAPCVKSLFEYSFVYYFVFVVCFITVKFKHVGQNKGKVTVPDDVGFDSNIIVGEILDSWFYEWK